MTMEHSENYVSKCLESADEMLEDARLLLEKNRSKSAADRAYQSMHHAAQGILYKLGVKLPKTHSGLISLFSKHVVKTGIIELEFGRMLSRIISWCP